MDATIAVTVTVTNVDEAGMVTLAPLSPEADSPVTAGRSDPDGGVTGATWQWESSADQTTWTAIAGATARTYSPAAGDVGQRLRATVSYTDALGAGKSASAVTGAVAGAAPAPAHQGPLHRQHAG